MHERVKSILAINSQLHDLIFSIGASILLVALLPVVIKKTILPISTCLITGGVLFVFFLNYLTMEYWYTTVVEAGNVILWAILLYRSLGTQSKEIL